MVGVVGIVSVPFRGGGRRSTGSGGAVIVFVALGVFTIVSRGRRARGAQPRNPVRPGPAGWRWDPRSARWRPPAPGRAAGAPNPPERSGPATVGTESVDPAALVTSADAEVALGAPVSVHRRPSTPEADSCTYLAVPPGAGNVRVATMKRVTTAAAFRRARADAERSIGPTRDVADLGDEAFLAGTSFLAVLQGRAALSITLHPGPAAAPGGNPGDVLSALARKAVARL